MGVGGSVSAPESQAVACFLDRRQRQQGHRTQIVFSFSMGKVRKSAWDKWGFLSCLHLSRSPIRCDMGPHSWRATGYSCPVGAAWEPLEAPAPGIRGGCWPAGCGTDPACSELSFDWAPKPRPGCSARGGLKTTQLKHRKHLGLYWGESGSFLKNPRRLTKP